MKSHTFRKLAVHLSLSLLFGFSPMPAHAQTQPWMDTALTPEQRADLLIAAETLDQKIEQLHGTPGLIPEVSSCGNGFRHIPGIPSLHIPTFRITKA